MLARISHSQWVHSRTIFNSYRTPTFLSSLSRPEPKVYTRKQGFQITRIRYEELKNSKDSSLPQGLTAEIVQEQPAMLYLDQVFPLRMNRFDIRQMLVRSTHSSLESMARKLIPTEGMPHNFKIVDVIPREKDGGALVKFVFESTEANKKEASKEITRKISDFLESRNQLSFFRLQPMRAFLVKGMPFMEDMVARYPTTRLRIEFQGEPVEVEKLYKHVRTYGRVYNISIYPNPHLSKDPPRYAIVQFLRIRSATCARNCLHGINVHGTRLNILYEQQLHTNVVKDWIVNHPRITIPVIAALIAFITYVIFDPIRVFFITSKVSQRFNLEEYSFYRWLRKETWARLVSGDHHTIDSQSMWTEGSEQIEKLQSWVHEKPETFVIVSGPKGSGKSVLVKAAMEDRRNKLLIDCEELSNARNKTELSKLLAEEIGYFPLFTWVSLIGGLLETMVTATTGQKAGISSTPDSQIKDILETAAIALRELSPRYKIDIEKKENDNPNKGLFTSFLKLDSSASDDSNNNNNNDKNDKDNDNNEKKDYNLDPLEEKAKLHSNREDQYNKEDIPVVIIDNFMHRETTKNAGLWKELAEWASILIENEIAHVIFISAHPGANRLLSKALPGKSFSSIVLADAPTELAIMFIMKRMGTHIVDEKLSNIVDALGGRLTELELLTAKMKAKMEPEAAFNEIVYRNLLEVLKYGFNEQDDLIESHKDWNAVQFWSIVKQLAKNKSCNYNQLKWSPLFNGDDKPLKAMERAEMITIIQQDGHPHSIRPGKPVFYTVFSRLVSDNVFSATMEIESNTQLKKISETNIAKFEETITTLSNVYGGRPPREIDTRIRSLLAKVAATQKLIEEYEAHISESKKIIEKDWKDQ
ncbi:RNA12 protein-domain-containing protein [Spinellus fusiger]|nr:RNA12 protein-domain-containing protein [Spinellus fusiger]